MRYYLTVFFLFFYSPVMAQDILFYLVGTSDGELSKLVLKSLKAQGIRFTVIEGTADLEKHVRIISSVNTEKKGLFIAMDIKKKEKSGLFVAVFSPKKPQGKLLRIDEIPSKHFESSMKVAECIATGYGKRVHKLPLFPLLGVDMPALYLRLHLNKESIDSVAKEISDGITKCFAKEQEYEIRR